MARDFPRLTEDLPLLECVRRLLENRMLGIPVVDAAGKYLGVFRKNLLIAEVLPQVARQDPRLERIARMIDAGLLQETLAGVRSRFAPIAHEPVRLHMDVVAPVLRPEQPLVAAMFYLFQGRNFLPVVEEKTCLLVGMVSAWDVLAHLIARD
ncbi:CBS domain-containing protein [Haloferula sargassicola]|uniref:CBS domain-containing protein n=1 Tax=Haloferula sargassicola TaxID=490096 RepID=A0ABP9UUZ4_9BACT